MGDDRTGPTPASVEGFIDRVDNADKRKDASVLEELLRVDRDAKNRIYPPA
ncbi:hypothetical protein [Aurantiacibacter gilvus]|uniref:Uncharacterized protein n=1 Tax=Aurantiacibacter gilvus TaxID=3139141 RepID=A0ABU9IE07_9SPHN